MGRLRLDGWLGFGIFWVAWRIIEIGRDDWWLMCRGCRGGDRGVVGLQLRHVVVGTGEVFLILIKVFEVLRTIIVLIVLIFIFRLKFVVIVCHVCSSRGIKADLWERRFRKRLDEEGTLVALRKVREVQVVELVQLLDGFQDRWPATMCEVDLYRKQLVHGKIEQSRKAASAVWCCKLT